LTAKSKPTNPSLILKATFTHPKGIHYAPHFILVLLKKKIETLFAEFHEFDGKWRTAI
jgi:hypothetical protein